MTPEISIILPTYNMGSLIGEAICSVLSSKIERLELIVVDDGSEDDSAGRVKQIIDSIPGSFNGNIISLHQQHRGKSSAVNLGLRRARGKYIAFIDADDRLPPGGLDKRLKRIRERQANMVIGGFSIIDEKGRFTGHRLLSPAITTRDLLRKTAYAPVSPFHLNAALFTRELANRTGFFDESLRRSQEKDYALKLLKASEKTVVLEEPVYEYRKHRRKRTDRIRLRLQSMYCRNRMLRNHFQGFQKWSAVPLQLFFDLLKLVYELFGNYRR